MISLALKPSTVVYTPIQLQHGAHGVAGHHAVPPVREVCGQEGELVEMVTHVQEPVWTSSSATQMYPVWIPVSHIASF